MNKRIFMMETGGVAAVDRAISILGAFKAADNDVTLAQLAQRTGLYKSTILRLLVSLESNGYVVRLSTGAYRLGPTLFHLGTLYQKSFRLEDHVKPVLERLARKTGESASFFIADGDARFCMFRAESDSQVRHRVQVGEKLPMDRGVGGKVLTIFAAGATLASPSQIEQLPYIALGKNELDIATIGGPVFGVGGKLLGVVCVSGPTLRYNDAAVSKISELLLANLRDLTVELGGEAAWFSAAERDHKHDPVDITDAARASPN
jgi:DNA-binding IclR family transcriptional regulator